MAELNEDKDGWLVDTAKGIAQGVVSAVNETVEFGQDVVKATNENLSGTMEKVIGVSRLYNTKEDGLKFGSVEQMNTDLAAEGTEPVNLTDIMEKTDLEIDGFGNKRDTSIGQVTQTLSQFISGLVGAGKITKWKNGKVIGGMGNGAIVGAVAFDPYEDNLFKILKDSKYEIIIPHITEALENKESGGKWENRLKNAVVESGLGGVADLAIIGITRVLKLRRKAKIEEKGYGKVLDRTAKELDEAELELEDALEALKADKDKEGIFNKDGTQFRATDGTVFETATGRRLEQPEVSVDFGNIDTLSKLTKEQVQEVSKPENLDNFLSKLSDVELDAFYKRKSFLARNDDMLPRTTGRTIEELIPDISVKRLEEPDVNVDFKNAEKIEKMNLVDINKVSDDELRAMSLPEYSTFQKRKVDLLKGVDQTGKLNPGFDNFKVPEFSLPKGPTSEVPTVKFGSDTSRFAIGEVPAGASGSVKKIVQTGDDTAPKLNDEVVIPKPEVDYTPPTIGSKTTELNTGNPVIKGGEEVSVVTPGGPNQVIKTLDNIDNRPLNLNSPSSRITLKTLGETIKNSRKATPANVVTNIDEVIDNIRIDNPIDGYINRKAFDDVDNIVTTANIVADSLNNSTIRKTLGLDTVAKEAKVFNDGLEEFAGLTGQSIDVFKKSALKPYKNVKDANKQLIKNKLIVRYALTEVDRLADEIIGLGDDVNTLLEKKLIAMMELATDAIAYTKGTTREIARGLQAGNIKIGANLTEEAMTKLAKWGGSAKVKALAKQLQDLKGNSVGKAKLLKEAQKNKFWAMTSEIWINSILSGFKTGAINITSNSYNLMIRPAIRLTGGVASGNGRMVEQSVREYIHIVSEVMDSLTYLTPLIRSSGDSAMQAAVRTFKSENGVIDKATKFDFDMDTSFKGSWKMDMAGVLVRAPSRFLKAQDEFAKQLSFRSNLKATILTDARRMKQIDFENLGYANKKEFIVGEIDKATLSKEALADQWETMVAYGRIPDDPKIKDAWMKDNLGLANGDSHYAVKALEEARESTFTTPLRDGLGKTVQGAIQKHPALRMIMPFVTTPMNILRTAFERTPIVGLATRGNLKKFLKGTPEEKALVRGNQIYGSLTVFTAYNLAMQGRITGGGPSYMADPAKAKLWNSSPDWQPYSINTGTAENPNWVELKRLDPHGTLYGIVGDIYEMMEYSQKDDADLYEGLALVAASIANNITSKTWMAGLNELNLLATGQAKPWEIRKITASRAAQFVPYSAMGMQLNQSQFDEVREIRGFVDQVKARIYQPLGKNLNLDFEGLPVKHDWLTGESVDTPDYMLGYIRGKKLDNNEIPAGKVYSELRKLNHTFNGPSRRIDKVELDGATFQRYNELVGTLKIDGKTLLQQLNILIDSKEYDKEGLIQGYNDVLPEESHRYKKINSRIQRYKQKAKSVLLREYPELKEILRSNKKTRSLQNSGDPSVNDENLIFEFSST